MKAEVDFTRKQIPYEGVVEAVTERKMVTKKAAIESH
jgi:hypothetical protein